MNFGGTVVVLSILYCQPNIWSPSSTPFPVGKMQWVDPKSIRCLTWCPYMQIFFNLTVMYLVPSIKLITFDIKLKDWAFFKTYLAANSCPLKHCVFSPPSCSGHNLTTVANTSVEILISEHVFSSVYGEDGSNLDRIIQVINCTDKRKYCCDSVVYCFMLYHLVNRIAWFGQLVARKLSSLL